MEFDIDDIIRYIRTKITLEVSEKSSDDDLMYIVNAIIDYDLDSGMFDINADFEEDTEADIEKLAHYVEKKINRRLSQKYSYEDIAAIVKAELEYEDSILN